MLINFLTLQAMTFNDQYTVKPNIVATTCLSKYSDKNNVCYKPDINQGTADALVPCTSSTLDATSGVYRCLGQEFHVPICPGDLKYYLNTSSNMYSCQCSPLLGTSYLDYFCANAPCCVTNCPSGFISAAVDQVTFCRPPNSLLDAGLICTDASGTALVGNPAAAPVLCVYTGNNVLTQQFSPLIPITIPGSTVQGFPHFCSYDTSCISRASLGCVAFPALSHADKNGFCVLDAACAAGTHVTLRNNTIACVTTFKDAYSIPPAINVATCTYAFADATGACYPPVSTQTPITFTDPTVATTVSGVKIGLESLATPSCPGQLIYIDDGTYTGTYRCGCPSATATPYLDYMCVNGPCCVATCASGYISVEGTAKFCRPTNDLLDLALKCTSPATGSVSSPVPCVIPATQFSPTLGYPVFCDYSTMCISRTTLKCVAQTTANFADAKGFCAARITCPTGRLATHANQTSTCILSFNDQFVVPQNPAAATCASKKADTSGKCYPPPAVYTGVTPAVTSLTITDVVIYYHQISVFCGGNMAYVDDGSYQGVLTCKCTTGTYIEYFCTQPPCCTTECASGFKSVAIGTVQFCRPEEKYIATALACTSPAAGSTSAPVTCIAPAINFNPLSTSGFPIFCNYKTSCISRTLLTCVGLVTSTNQYADPKGFCTDVCTGDLFMNANFTKTCISGFKDYYVIPRVEAASGCASLRSDSSGKCYPMNWVAQGIKCSQTGNKGTTIVCYETLLAQCLGEMVYYESSAGIYSCHCAIPTNFVDYYCQFPPCCSATCTSGFRSDVLSGGVTTKFCRPTDDLLPANQGVKSDEGAGNLCRDAGGAAVAPSTGTPLICIKIGAVSGPQLSPISPISTFPALCDYNSYCISKITLNCVAQFSGWWADEKGFCVNTPCTDGVLITNLNRTQTCLTTFNDQYSIPAQPAAKTCVSKMADANGRCWPPPSFEVVKCTTNSIVGDVTICWETLEQAVCPGDLQYKDSNTNIGLYLCSCSDYTKTPLVDYFCVNPPCCTASCSSGFRSDVGTFKFCRPVNALLEAGLKSVDGGGANICEDAAALAVVPNTATPPICAKITAAAVAQFSPVVTTSPLVFCNYTTSCISPTTLLCIPTVATNFANPLGFCAVIIADCTFGSGVLVQNLNGTQTCIVKFYDAYSIPASKIATTCLSKQADSSGRCFPPTALRTVTCTPQTTQTTTNGVTTTTPIKIGDVQICWETLSGYPCLGDLQYVSDGSPALRYVCKCTTPTNYIDMYCTSPPCCATTCTSSFFSVAVNGVNYCRPPNSMLTALKCTDSLGVVIAAPTTTTQCKFVAGPLASPEFNPVYANETLCDYSAQCYDGASLQCVVMPAASHANINGFCTADGSCGDVLVPLRNGTKICVSSVFHDAYASPPSKTAIACVSSLADSQNYCYPPASLQTLQCTTTGVTIGGSDMCLETLMAPECPGDLIYVDDGTMTGRFTCSCPDPVKTPMLDYFCLSPPCCVSQCTTGFKSVVEGITYCRPPDAIVDDIAKSSGCQKADGSQILPSVSTPPICEIQNGKVAPQFKPVQKFPLFCDYSTMCIDRKLLICRTSPTGYYPDANGFCTITSTCATVPAKSSNGTQNCITSFKDIYVTPINLAAKTCVSGVSDSSGNCYPPVVTIHTYLVPDLTTQVVSGVSIARKTIVLFCKGDQRYQDDNKYTDTLTCGCQVATNFIDMFCTSPPCCTTLCPSGVYSKVSNIKYCRPESLLDAAQKCTDMNGDLLIGDNDPAKQQECEYVKLTGATAPTKTVPLYTPVQTLGYPYICDFGTQCIDRTTLVCKTPTDASISDPNGFCMTCAGTPVANRNNTHTCITTFNDAYSTPPTVSAKSCVSFLADSQGNCFPPNQLDPVTCTRSKLLIGDVTICAELLASYPCPGQLKYTDTGLFEGKYTCDCQIPTATPYLDYFCTTSPCCVAQCVSGYISSVVSNGRTLKFCRPLDQYLSDTLKNSVGAGDRCQTAVPAIVPLSTTNPQVCAKILGVAVAQFSPLAATGFPAFCSYSNNCIAADTLLCTKTTGFNYPDINGFCRLNSTCGGALSWNINGTFSCLMGCPANRVLEAVSQQCYEAKNCTGAWFPQGLTGVTFLCQQLPCTGSSLLNQYNQCVLRTSCSGVWVLVETKYNCVDYSSILVPQSYVQRKLAVYELVTSGKVGSQNALTTYYDIVSACSSTQTANEYGICVDTTTCAKPNYWWPIGVALRYQCITFVSCPAGQLLNTSRFCAAISSCTTYWTETDQTNGRMCSPFCLVNQKFRNGNCSTAAIECTDTTKYTGNFILRGVVNYCECTASKILNSTDQCVDQYDISQCATGSVWVLNAQQQYECKASSFCSKTSQLAPIQRLCTACPRANCKYLDLLTQANVDECPSFLSDKDGFCLPLSLSCTSTVKPGMDTYATDTCPESLSTMLSSSKIISELNVNAACGVGYLAIQQNLPGILYARCEKLLTKLYVQQTIGYTIVADGADCPSGVADIIGVCQPMTYSCGNDFKQIFGSTKTTVCVTECATGLADTQQNCIAASSCVYKDVFAFTKQTYKCVAVCPTTSGKLAYTNENAVCSLSAATDAVSLECQAFNSVKSIKAQPDCISTCPTGYYADSNKICKAIAVCAADEFKILQSNSQTICVATCPSGFADRAAGSCVRSISCAAYTDNHKGTLYCATECASGIADASKICVTSCPTFMKSNTALTKICTTACDAGYRADQTGFCQDPTWCSTGKLYVALGSDGVEVAGRYVCVTPATTCKTGYILVAGNICANKLSLYWQYNVAGYYEQVTTCQPSKVVGEDQICTSACISTSYQRIDTNGQAVCVLNCPAGFKADTTMICIALAVPCTANSFQYQNGQTLQCVVNCPTNYANEKSVCVDSTYKCPSLAQLIGTTKACVASCAVGQVCYRDETSCATGVWKQTITGTQTTFACVAACDIGMYIDANRLCVATCPDGFVSLTGYCMYKVSGVIACPSTTPFTVQLSANLLQCLANCPTLTANEKNECQTTAFVCHSFYQMISATKTCVDPSAGTPVTCALLNENRICASQCTSAKSFMDQFIVTYNGKNYTYPNSLVCVADCLSLKALSTKVCIPAASGTVVLQSGTGCPDGEFLETFSSTSFCTATCSSGQAVDGVCVPLVICTASQYINKKSASASECVAECPSGFATDANVCVPALACAAFYLTTGATTKCSDECATGFAVQQTAGLYCTAKCDVYQQQITLKTTKQCVTECSSLVQKDGTCLTSCAGFRVPVAGKTTMTCGAACGTGQTTAGQFCLEAAQVGSTPVVLGLAIGLGSACLILMLVVAICACRNKQPGTGKLKTTKKAPKKNTSGAMRQQYTRSIFE